MQASIARCGSLKEKEHEQLKNEKLLRRDSFNIFPEPKVFNDPIHGLIEMPPLLVRIIDTPEFQRLRDLKQLGGTYMVYPGASHNRFEHSIGVAYLAGCLLNRIRREQPELEISRDDVLCVQVAGLCHDLGHGPYSHLFDSMFIPNARPGCMWKHEKASLAMLDYLLDKNNLRALFKEEDLMFVKELIDSPSNMAKPEEPWPCKARGIDKCFLYEIVANKMTGVDVDKWDYFARDSKYLGFQSHFHHDRLVQFSKVMKDPYGRMTLCYNEKEVSNLYNMYHTRNWLHRQAYQHKVANVVELMVTEAFLEVDRVQRAHPDDPVLEAVFGFSGPLSETIDDMSKYVRCTDSLVWKIIQSSTPLLAEARALLESVQRRSLYKFVDETPSLGSSLDNELRTRRAIASCVPTNELPTDPEGRPVQLDPDDILIHNCKFHYGMGNKNPLAQVYFFKKGSEVPFTIKKEQCSRMLPDVFSEQVSRVYIKKRSKWHVDAARMCFVRWCEKNAVTLPRGGDSILLLTPAKPLTSQQPSTTKSHIAMVLANKTLKVRTPASSPGSSSDHVSNGDGKTKNSLLTSSGDRGADSDADTDVDTEAEKQTPSKSSLSSSQTSTSSSQSPPHPSLSPKGKLRSSYKDRFTAIGVSLLPSNTAPTPDVAGSSSSSSVAASPVIARTSSRSPSTRNSSAPRAAQAAANLTSSPSKRALQMLHSAATTEESSSAKRTKSR